MGSPQLSAYIVYAIRKQVAETTDFSHLKNTQQITSVPWKTLLRHHKKSIFASCLIAGLTIVPLYCATILGNKFFKEIGYSSSECMMLNTFGMFVDAFTILYFGKISDKVGFHRQMLLGTLFVALIAIPSFYPLVQNIPSHSAILWFIFSLVAAGCIINGCGMPYIASYFPTNCRYTGVALSATIGHAIFGGTTPLIGSYLTDLMGTRLAPALWVITLSLVTFFMVKLVGKPKYLKG